MKDFIPTMNFVAEGKRSKVLALIKGLGLGGAERLLVDALPYLDRERFDYSFAYLLPWKNFLVPQIEEAGFAVHCLGMRKPHHLPLTLQRLRALYRKERFDLIHAHLPVAGILARVAGRALKVPVIYTEHNLQERYSTLTRRANALTYGWNKRVLAVSQEVAGSIERLGLNHKTRVTTLLNGVPIEQVRSEAANQHGLREELGIPSGHLVIGNVAVFRRQKRLGDWLEVARRICDRRDDVTFLLVGDGPEAPFVKAKVADLGLKDRVVMPGFRPDGRRLMELMDVFLMTSEFEGLPIALLEAMSLSKPVVATQVGGIPEVISEGEEGLLAPAGAVDGLALLAMKLLDDPRIRAEMGKRGARRVEEGFHLKDRIRFTEDLYAEVLKESSGHQLWTHTAIAKEAQR